MNLSRREFGKKIAFTALGARIAMLTAVGGSVELAGCNVIDDIENWVPVGEAAVNSILALLGANGIAITPAITLAESVINAALVALKDAVIEYEATTPPPVGTLQKIEAAAQAVVDNFGTFFTALGLPQVSSIANLILSLVKVVVSTVMGFINDLTGKTKTVTASVSLKAAGQVVSVTPKKRTKRAFKHDWNDTLKVAGSGVVCPASVYMKVSFFEHF